MYITEKSIRNKEWVALEEVNTGDSFLIQNISDNIVRYIVLDSVPENNLYGNVIQPYQQLAFRKITGDMYIKQNGDENAYIAIEKVEVSE